MQNYINVMCMQCLKWGSKVGGPEIGTAHGGQKVDGHGPPGPIDSAAYGCIDRAPHTM